MGKRGFNSKTAALAGSKGKRGPGKEVVEIRQAFSDLLDNNMPKVQGWLNEIAKEDPKGALDMVLKMAEYCLPKLARIEHVPDTDNLDELEVKIKLIQ